MTAQRGIFICILAVVLNAPQSARSFERESAHFIFYYSSQDSAVIDSVLLRLENSYGRITEDLQLTITTKIGVHIYPSLQEFHNAIGWPDAPDWLVGVGNQEIYVVSPLNPGPAHSYKDIMDNVFIHEFTHVCTGKIGSYLPYWLYEGFACYEGGPYYSKASVVSSYNSLGRIPTLDELGSSYDNFVSLGGYPFSLSIATFAVDKFGMDAMRQFIYHPDDFSVFGGWSKSQFQEQWFEYVKVNYLGITSAPQVLQRASGIPCVMDKNYANPFNPKTIISYRLSVVSTVSLKVYNILGTEVATLVEKEQHPGRYEVSFDAANLSSGMYFYRLEAGNYSVTHKMVLLK